MLTVCNRAQDGVPHQRQRQKKGKIMELLYNLKGPDGHGSLGQAALQSSRLSSLSDSSI